MTRVSQRLSSGALLCRAALWLSAIFLCLLAACGGGGGGGGSSSPPNLNSAPGAAAVNAYVQASHSNTLNARDQSGNNWTAQLSTMPNPGTTTFNGIPNVSTAVQTVNIFENGVLAGNDIRTNYFLVNPYQPLGDVFTTGPVEIVSGGSPLPMTITVGQSGPLDTVTAYHDSTQSTVDATEVETFSVVANNPTTLLFCVNTVTSNVTAQGNLDGFSASTESDCYAVDASGNANLVKVVLTINGVTLTFQ